MSVTPCVDGSIDGGPVAQDVPVQVSHFDVWTSIQK
jgi:hypothetical protein